MGRLHVDQMLREMSSHEFGEWLAWWNLEPRDGQRLEPYLAQLAELQHNAWFKKPQKMDEFMFDFEKKEEKKLTPAEESEAIRQLYGQAGANTKQVSWQSSERIGE